jgi:hypothetical protein
MTFLNCFRRFETVFAYLVLGGLREASLAVADDVPDISPGLRWLADRFDTLEGHTVDQEERDVDNSPPTGLQFALGDIALGTAEALSLSRLTVGRVWPTFQSPNRRAHARRIVNPKLQTVQRRTGSNSGATSTSMLRATPGFRRTSSARSRASTIW